MDRDDVGTVDNPRLGWEQEAPQAPDGVPEAHEGGPDSPKARSCGNELQERQLEVEDIVCSLPADVRDALAEESVMGLLMQWEGELPDPESFSKYPDYVQEALVKWGDVRTVRESERLDKIVDSTSKSVAREQWMTFGLNMLFALLTFAAFLCTGSWVSFGLMAVPAITIAVNVRNRENERERKE